MSITCDDREIDLKDQLIQPAHDIRYLLSRGYPKTGAIQFVCDHYRLTVHQRHVLTRIVMVPELVGPRISKRVSCSDLENCSVAVDGYNVLIAVESILKGYCMWLGDDGYVRDTRGIFRKFKMTDNTFQAVDIVLRLLNAQNVRYVHIILDSQMSQSGKLAAHLLTVLAKYQLDGDTITSKQADHDLKMGNSDVVATADGVIIDAVDHVVDIPACIMDMMGIIPATIP
ncbi:MAG: DUF434 domain-containing protein [Methanosarcinaceae archaeon]|nr:DUF434 domain-containing protein [Methanosarcinaceae archaeon]